jgi:hypothetical protein
VFGEVLLTSRDIGFLAFGNPPPGRLAPRASGHAECNAVQPRAERFWLSDRASFPGQYEKDCLCGVLCIMQIADDVEADSNDYRAVTLDESGESGLG